MDQFSPDKFIAAMDQVGTSLENYSRLLCGFRQNLIDGGFTPEMAEKFVWAWFIKNFMDGKEPR